MKRFEIPKRSSPDDSESDRIRHRQARIRVRVGERGGNCRRNSKRSANGRNAAGYTETKYVSRRIGLETTVYGRWSAFLIIRYRSRWTSAKAISLVSVLRRRGCAADHRSASGSGLLGEGGMRMDVAPDSR